MIPTIIPYVFLVAGIGLFVASGFFRSPERHVIAVGLSSVCFSIAAGLFIGASV